MWNDLLVALVFVGGTPDVEVLTQRLLGVLGALGTDWHLLSAIDRQELYARLFAEGS